jgi:hypothetical protein
VILINVREDVALKATWGHLWKKMSFRYLMKSMRKIKPYLSKESIKAIENQGKYIFDEDGEYSTPTINGSECAYAVYDESGILKCGIEKASEDGKTSFKKPISCHLYPIRISKYDSYYALNYDRWEICLPACELGRKTKLPLYKFLKDPLIRKFGEAWYESFVIQLKILLKKYKKMHRFE